MKSWIAFWAAAIAVLGGLLFWKNTAQFGVKSLSWRARKSVIEMGLILMTAVYLPALLVCWCVLWLTRPIQNQSLRITMSVVLGVSLGVMSGWALELVVLASVFGIDTVTGRDGFLRNWARAEHKAEQIAA